MEKNVVLRVINGNIDGTGLKGSNVRDESRYENTQNL